MPLLSRCNYYYNRTLIKVLLGRKLADVIYKYVVDVIGIVTTRPINSQTLAASMKRMQIPAPTLIHFFDTSNGNKYVELRWKREDLELDRKTAGSIAENLGLPMIPIEEAGAIRDSAESSAVFLSRLQPQEWTHVSAPAFETKERHPRAAYLLHQQDGKLEVDDVESFCLATALILKIVNKTATSAVPHRR